MPVCQRAPPAWPEAVDAWLRCVRLKPDQEESLHHENRRDHGRQDASNQGDGKTLHRARAVLIEHRGGKRRGHVRVDDRAHRVLEALVDGRTERLAVHHLLANALEDQHVGVDRDTDRETKPARPGNVSTALNPASMASVNSI